MSLSSGIDQYNPDVNLRARFYPDLIPWEADPRGDMTLGAVLQNGNSANNPDTGLPQDATDFDLLGCKEIATGKVFQGNNLSLQIGDPLDTIQIKGATDIGSILVGNGVNTEELKCPTSAPTPFTQTVYNWNTLSNGQSKVFTVNDGSIFQLGYSITITYSGTDFITGTITAVVGDDITLTITNKGSQAYVNAPLIATTPPDPSIAGSLTDPVFLLNPATTTPTPPELTQFSMITGGLCYLYSVNGNPNPVPFTIEVLGTNIDRPVSATANTPLYENPPTTPTAYAYADGCFVRDTQIVQIQANTSGVPVDFGFPTSGSFAPADFCGTISGYTLLYGAGSIEINSKLVLTADNTKPLGVFWGVDAQGVGTVTSVSAGTNISISGSLSAPVVNFATPTTSNIQLGVGTELLATSGNTTMSIDSTGLTDTYSSGGVVNLEDIAVSSTNVVQTLSTTDGSNYSNSSVLTCNQSGITDQKTATENVSNYTGGVGLSCFPTATSVGCGITYPTSPPFPNADGNISIGVSSGGGSLTPSLSLTASAPFQPSYSTILDRDGITQNNSSGNGFRCKSAQDIFLEPTNGQPNPQLGVIRIPNGNSINMSVDTYTTTYRKDGMSVNDIFTPSSYACACDLTATGGTSQLFLGSSNIGTSQHTLRAEVPLVGDATIEHEIVSGASRNLVISSQGNITTTATGNATLQGSGSNIVCGINSINGTSQVFQNFSSQSGTSATPNFIFREVAPTATGACVIKMDKAVAPTVGNAISAIASYALDGTGTTREWSRIQTKVENVGAGNQDGTLSIFNSVNGVVSETFNFNGAQNENNSFRPLDMNNNDIRTATGNLTLNATASTGTGHIILQPKVAGEVQIAGAIAQLTNPAGQLNISANTNMSISANNITETSASSHTIATPTLVFTGAGLQSGTSSGNSGQHLVITLNGVVYKIALQNP